MDKDIDVEVPTVDGDGESAIATVDLDIDLLHTPSALLQVCVEIRDVQSTETDRMNVYETLVTLTDVDLADEVIGVTSDFNAR